MPCQCCTSPCCDFNDSAYSLICRQRRKEVMNWLQFWDRAPQSLYQQSSCCGSLVDRLFAVCLSVSVSFVLLQPEAAGQSVSQQLSDSRSREGQQHSGFCSIIHGRFCKEISAAFVQIEMCAARVPLGEPGCFWSKETQYLHHVKLSCVFVWKWHTQQDEVCTSLHSFWVQHLPAECLANIIVVTQTENIIYYLIHCFLTLSFIHLKQKRGKNPSATLARSAKSRNYTFFKTVL